MAHLAQISASCSCSRCGAPGAAGRHQGSTRRQLLRRSLVATGRRSNRPRGSRRRGLGRTRGKCEV